MLGHDGPPTALITRHLLTDKPLKRCPVRTIQLAHERRPATATEFDRYANVYYPQWKGGHLLGRGGIGDQPARYVAMIGVFQEVESRVETQLIKIMKPQPTE